VRGVPRELTAGDGHGGGLVPDVYCTRIDSKLLLSFLFMNYFKTPSSFSTPPTPASGSFYAESGFFLTGTILIFGGIDLFRILHC